MVMELHNKCVDSSPVVLPNLKITCSLNFRRNQRYYLSFLFKISDFLL